MIITNVEGRRFFVHVVFRGEFCGNPKNGIVNTGPHPTIEFYDFTYANATWGPRGQFVSRYFSDTLATPTGRGLCLNGGCPEWSIDEETMAPVYELAKLITK